MPLPVPAVAIDGLLLVQVPPEVASVNVTEVPLQNDVGPEMAAGADTTVMVFVALQPPDMV
jgi:hypothetical protein